MLIFYLRYDIMLKAQKATIQDKHLLLQIWGSADYATE